MKRISLILVILLMVLTPSATAESDENVPRFRLFGDLRLRAEADWDSTRSDGRERDDRERGRIRARLGLAWNAGRWDVTTRLRTGNTDGQQSPHITLLQSGDKGDRDVLLDRLFVRYGSSGRQIWVGRNGDPFWRPTEFLLDDDVYWDGVGISVAVPGGSARGLAAFVPEGEASLSLEDQGVLLGLQYVRPIGASKRVTVAGSLMHIADDGDEFNPVLLDLDYTIADLTLEWRAPTRNLTLGGEVMYNLNEPSGDVFLRHERGGLVLWTSIGSLGSPGGWLGAVYLAHVEKYAVVPFLAQDDWVRWGSATQTRSSNFEGVELRVAHAIRKDMNVVARLYLVEGIEREGRSAISKEDGKRARIDLNWKF